MADYSFIANPPQHNSLQSISSMMGIARGAQELQKGGVDLKLAQELLQPRIEQGKAVSEAAKTEAQQRAFSLTKEQAATGQNIAAGLFRDPRIVKGDHAGTIDALVEARKDAVHQGVPAHMAEGMFAELIALSREPGAVLRRLQNLTQAQAQAGARAGVLNAPLSGTQTGGGTIFNQHQPGAIGGSVQPGQVIPNTLAPGSLETIEEDSARNKHVISRSPQGSILSTRPMPGSQLPGVAPGGASPPPFTALMPGQGGEIADSQKEVARVRENAGQVPTIRTINKEILRLSADTKTGPGTEFWQSKLGAVAALWGGNASSYQELGKYLEQNAIRNMEAMGGPPSDARLSAAAAANGSPTFNPEALQSVTKFNDATALALTRYREGLDKAIGTTNANYAAVPAFKAAWSQALSGPMGVDVFRYINAHEAGDKKEIEKILGRPGAEQDRKRQALAEKYQALKQLWEGAR